ncbi:MULTISPECIES: PTS sugar transporter subunit IIA [unclassified Leclercia]|uniref:PTS sugar transporter subunit IIA n=1 Tax=unclassified Leclercia TaxID=2627398 RepID=UPI000CD02B98|nr:PTS sugar transporter subunit IIA [Leclercia sp. LSNIH1]AUU84682.1 PTS sugar transporter [Leclercia sp. LSNIH1]NYU08198.1 PTS sugar transporter [Enterobacteriaceae bacterium CCUG 67584]POV35244.1 PTS sugar transporter [Leclercia sp. LSNIH5]POW67517.1 PTS sugar transporter [Leclercia sp. LSNIH2]
MKRHYIFASHGTFARGLLDSVELILGKQQDIHTLCAYVDENRDLTEQVDTLLASLPEEDEVIAITDIFAGSVNNEFIRFLHRPNFHLIAGLNLPLVIGLLISADEQDSEKLIHEALFSSRESIQYCNQSIASALQADKDF